MRQGNPVGRIEIPNSDGNLQCVAVYPCRTEPSGWIYPNAKYLFNATVSATTIDTSLQKAEQ